MCCLTNTAHTLFGIRITTKQNAVTQPTNMSTPITLHTCTLDNKHVAYSSQTEFLVQVGKGRGSYSTRYRFVGNIAQAVFYYRGINVGNGYKKRLFVPSFNKPTLAKQFS